jgi:hypothetical protein
MCAVRADDSQQRRFDKTKKQNIRAAGSQTDHCAPHTTGEEGDSATMLAEERVTAWKQRREADGEGVAAAWRGLGGNI